LEVNFDQDHTRRILENLLNNAVKYGSDLTPINVTVKIVNNELCMSVHNWGNPIAETDFEKIFQPFGRTQEAADSGIKGWGLGLSLVRSIVKSHRGHLDVASSEGQGTTFSIRIPL
jgi:signal transduction histidine kinase